MAMNNNIPINFNEQIERDINFNTRNKKQSLHQDLQFMFWD